MNTNTPQQLNQNPLFESLKDSQRILLAGAGGGCDVLCAVPLYVALKGMNKDLHLANLTFTNLYGASGECPKLALMTIDANAGGSEHYFPERRLCEWFESQGESIRIHCIHRTGVKPIREAYEHLIQAHRIDTVILVDGGTDSLARGDEAGLGTPQEDMASLAAVDLVEVERKLLVCLGFGVDAFHGICHAHFLEAVADLAKTGGFLGAFSLLASMPEATAYQDATAYLSRNMTGRESIVNTSISSAIDGEYGDFHMTMRTKESQLWINPLMALYWTFDLDAVARRSLYLDRLYETETYREVSEVIEHFRHETDVKPWEAIPV